MRQELYKRIDDLKESEPNLLQEKLEEHDKEITLQGRFLKLIIGFIVGIIVVFFLTIIMLIADVCVFHSSNNQNPCDRLEQTDKKIEDLEDRIEELNDKLKDGSQPSPNTSDKDIDS